MASLSFTVFGTPQPQGSMRGFMRGKHVIVTSDNAKLKPWRQEIAGVATVEVVKQGFARIERPHAAWLIATYYFDRPKSKGKKVEKTTKPDLDKLLRATKDSLKGIVYDDDSQVTKAVVEKVYGAPARVDITVMNAEQRATQVGGDDRSVSAL